MDHRLSPLVMFAAATLLSYSISACKDDEPSRSSGTDDPGDGDGDGDGTGDGDGDGDGDGTPTKPGDGDGDGDGDGSCEPGTLYCACDDGECDAGLECYEATDICIEDPCPDGTEGCECIDGSTGCEDGLDCVNGYCVDEGCVGPYEPCYDNDEGWLGDCCNTLTCVGIESTNEWECVPTCFTHSECTTGCCSYISDVDENYCAVNVSLCQDYGYCIDTCVYHDDGDCDDGGPDSDYSLCEYGTDCADCGVRY